jgi:ABC-type branched-subunit amino acid transport system ATPase component
MQVIIERFKNLQSVDLELSGLTLLVGGNNAGKSSVLQAIQFGVAAAQTSQMQGGFWTNDRLPTSIGQSDLVYSPIKDVLSLGPNGRLREPEADAIRITYRDGANEARVSVRKGRNKNVVLELVGRTLGSDLQSIQQPFSALVTGLAGIRAEEDFETNIVVRKAAARGDSNSVFRNILLQLRRDAGRWHLFQQQVHRLFPNYQVEVSFDPDADETIRCFVTRDGVEYPIDSCGTGVLQAVQIFAYINLFNPRLLLLDEPDSHLHPNNQKQLARELIAASSSGLNIVVSTHSRHLVEALIDHSRLVWLRGGAIQPNADNYEVQALLEIGALNVGERIGNPTNIVLTEDENKNVIEILLEANGVDLDDCEIVSYAGCTQINTARALISHLRRTWPNARYVLHRDRDFLDQATIDSYIQQFERMGVSVFIPRGNDLESYFVTPQHLQSAFQIPEADANDIVNAAYLARRDDLLAKYVNTRIGSIRKANGQIDAGALAVEANNAIVGPGSSAVHGKILLAGIRHEAQQRGIRGQLLACSAALSCPIMAALMA